MFSADKLKNVFLNLMGAAVSTGVQQLIVYPYLAAQYTEAEYGSLLFLLGTMNVVALTLGNALGDIRMIRNSDYEEAGKTGDFNLLIAFLSLLAGVAYVAVGSLALGMPLFAAILLGGTVLLETVNAYTVMFFRLQLKYWHALGTTVAKAVGYLVGILLERLTGQWIIILFTSYLFSFVYQLITTPFLRESFRKTPRFSKTVSQYSTLSASYLLKSSLTYIDRFALFPMIGAEMVSVYTVATVFGKCVSLVIQPIANVLLGYISQRGFRLSAKTYCKITAACLGLGALSLVGVLLISEPVLGFLYPTYLDAVKPYLLIANVTAMINAVTSIIQPFILKFAKVSLQVVIQASYGVITIGLALILIPVMGLAGFCLAALAASIAKLLIMFFSGFSSLRKQEA